MKPSWDTLFLTGVTGAVCFIGYKLVKRIDALVHASDKLERALNAQQKAQVKPEPTIQTESVVVNESKTEEGNTALYRDWYDTIASEPTTAPFSLKKDLAVAIALKCDPHTFNPKSFMRAIVQHGWVSWFSRGEKTVWTEEDLGDWPQVYMECINWAIREIKREATYQTPTDHNLILQKAYDRAGYRNSFKKYPEQFDSVQNTLLGTNPVLHGLAVKAHVSINTARSFPRSLRLMTINKPFNSTPLTDALGGMTNDTVFASIIYDNLTVEGVDGSAKIQDIGSRYHVVINGVIFKLINDKLESKK